MAAMILGALPFTFHYGFVRKRFMLTKVGTYRYGTVPKRVRITGWKRTSMDACRMFRLDFSPYAETTTLEDIMSSPLITVTPERKFKMPCALCATVTFASFP